MKRKLYFILVIMTIFILILNIFTKSKILDDAIIFSSNLFIKNIMPSLFPMFVISGILVELGFPKLLGAIFNKVFYKLFKTKGEISFIFFMSLLTGFPSSAKNIEDLLNKNLISIKDANKALTFTFFSNPLFIINTIGIIFFKDIKIGIMLFICHFLSNIIIGILYRNYNKNNDIKTNTNSLKEFYNTVNNKSIFNIVFQSIKTSIETLINIFGVITFFIIIINIFFKSPYTISKVFAIGLFEITTGLKLLNILNISKKIKILLSGFFISFGGFSVHMQIMSILKEKKIKYLPFLLSRIIHGILTVILLEVGMLF